MSDYDRLKEILTTEQDPNRIARKLAKPGALSMMVANNETASIAKTLLNERFSAANVDQVINTIYECATEFEKACSPELYGKLIAKAEQALSID